MTTNTIPMLALPLVLALCACDPAPQACEVLPTTYRAMTLNGVQMNGRVINGRDLNGMNLGNGSIVYNGVQLEGLELDGSTLTAVADDGSVLTGTAMLGARLPATNADGEIVEVEVAAVHPTPGRPDLTSYTLTLAGANICADDAAGIFLAGVWDETATRRDGLAGAQDFAYTFACSGGALAKCVDWGYAPWVVGQDVHQSCTRMVRADYCGDGDSYTKDGTLIEVGDAIGVQTFVTDPDMEFEAGWGPSGAVCVNKPRFWESVGDAGPILPWCWEQLPACDSLAEATDHAAAVANRSYDAERHLCAPR
jgi:hypothetical protein